MKTHLTSVAALRALYAAPQERAVRKQIAALDVHCRRFIELSPFFVLATTDKADNLDASPRGGAPGFVKVNAAGELLVPDAPGNNRLDSLENIIATGKAGLLFLIPGFDETLRVNGSGVVSEADADLAWFNDERRAPKTVIKVHVEAAYLHCAKAFMRSKLWQADAQVKRTTLPSQSTRTASAVHRFRKRCPGECVAIEAPTQFAPPLVVCQARGERREHDLLGRLEHLQRHQSTVRPAHRREACPQMA